MQKNGHRDFGLEYVGRPDFLKESYVGGSE